MARWRSGNHVDDGAGMARPADLAGQRPLVTGAARGIGAVIARRLAGAGAHVFVGYAHGEAARAKRYAPSRPPAAPRRSRRPTWPTPRRWRP
jgi:hypothetical protein